MVCPVFFWALNKEALCWLLKKHSAKKNTGQRGFFAKYKKTIGKERIC
jgi:hypothetical protein